jgi:energy-coupling factor transporter ATP-binding protein EcfA2
LADIAFEIADLWYWYQEEVPVLRGVNLQVPWGQALAVVGANGSGKTTLVKHLNGLLRPQRGRVLLGGCRSGDRALQDAALSSIGQLARQVGYLFQHPEQQIFSATVRQELAFGPSNLGLPAPEAEARVAEALTRFDLAAVADQPPAILGYGIRRRVTLASLAAMDTPILVLDEPSVGLDLAGMRETSGWLNECRAEGRTIVLVTHDMALVAEIADRVVVLHQGELVADGRPAELFWQTHLLAQASLAPPPTVALAQALRPHGLRGDGLTAEALCADYVARVGSSPVRDPGVAAPGNGGVPHSGTTGGGWQP